MVNSSSTLRRFIATCTFAVAAAAAPVIGAALTPTAVTPLAQCSGGEEQDVFTATCTPFLVPNSPDITTTAANPDVPEVQGIPCNGGRSSAACFGLLENEEDAGPQPVPRSTISASP
jgi:hypothetical protein